MWFMGVLVLCFVLGWGGLGCLVGGCCVWDGSCLVLWGITLGFGALWRFLGGGDCVWVWWLGGVVLEVCFCGVGVCAWFPLCAWFGIVWECGVVFCGGRWGVLGRRFWLAAVGLVWDECCVSRRLWRLLLGGLRLVWVFLCCWVWWGWSCGLCWVLGVWGGGGGLWFIRAVGCVVGVGGVFGVLVVARCGVGWVCSWGVVSWGCGCLVVVRDVGLGVGVLWCVAVVLWLGGGFGFCGAGGLIGGLWLWFLFVLGFG